MIYNETYKYLDNINRNRFKSKECQEYLLDRKLKSEIISNGIVLPVKKIDNENLCGNGGILDSSLQYVKSSAQLAYGMKNRVNDSYDISNEDIIYRNEEVVYLDNIDVVPNYDFGVVDYRTKNSNYKMILKTLCFDFSRSNRTIALNSLLFNIDELPKRIDKETIFDSIINLKKEKKNECKKITNSVDLSVKIDDFYDQFALLNESVDKLDTMTSTKEIKDVLKNIKGLIDELKNRSSEYDSNLSKTEENITLEGLKNEKIKLLERREWKKENCC